MGKVNIGRKLSLIALLICLQPSMTVEAENVDVSGPQWKKPTGGKVISVLPSSRYSWIYALSEDRTIHCIDSEGSPVWQSERLPNRPTGAAAGTDESLYVSTNRNELYAFNPAGRIVWSVGLSGTIRGDIQVGDDGMLYYLTSSGYIAARTHIGRLAWQRQLDMEPLTSLGFDGFGRLWIILSDGTGLSMDLDGRILSRFKVSIKGASGTMFGDTMLSCDTNGVYILSGQSISSYDPEGILKWSVSLDSKWTACALDAEFLFVSTDKGSLSALEKETGSRVWTKTIFTGTRYIQHGPRGQNVLAANGMQGTLFMDLKDGSVLQHFVSPRAAGKPLVVQENFYIPGDDWLVYSYSLKKTVQNAFSLSGIRTTQKTDSVVPLSAKDMYTREIMDLADRSEYERLLDRLEDDLRSLTPEGRYRTSLNSVQILAGVGVLNPIYRDGFLINDFPDIRLRSVQILSKYGTSASGELLLRLIRYEWDPVVSEEIIAALGVLRSDPNGEVVNTLQQLVHGGRIPIDKNPGIALTLIDSLDKICRYGGIVRSSASQLLNELYFSNIPREFRMKAIETLRSLGDKK